MELRKEDKKMKKYAFILWAALAMTGSFTACTNEDTPMSEQTTVKPVTICATIDGDLGSRVALTDDVENQKVKVDWKQGDDFKITVNGSGYTFTYTANNTFECSDANFPATFTSAGTVTATYPATTPTAYASQPGTLEGAAALLTMTATIDVTEGQSTGNLNLNFKHNNSIVKMTLSNDDFKSKNVTGITLKSGSTAVATATTIFTDDADNGSIVAYFAVTPQEMKDIVILAVCEGSYYGETLNDNTLTAGKLYNVSKGMTKVTGDVAAANAVKGDFALLDGTFISNTTTTLTSLQKAVVSGIVFWTTADSNTSGSTPAKLTDDKIMQTDFPNCTHGLIVSLKDVSQGTKWQESYTKIADWQTNTFNPDNKSDYKSVASGTAATDPINYILGYQNTKILKAYNESLSDDESANTVLPVSLLDDFSDDNPAPANTTGWFIPSEKELTLLYGFDADNVWGDGFNVGSVTKTQINNILNGWGDDANVLADVFYWSSSEYAGDDRHAFEVYFSSGRVNGRSKDGGPDYVRAVCAF